MSKAPLLQTPTQHEYRNPAVELNPKRLSKELKSLPLLNLFASIRALLHSIEPCNSERMAGKLRLRLLELYRETVISIFPSVEDTHLQKLPITGQQRKQVKEDFLKLCGALANGYKILVKEGVQEGQSPQHDPVLLTAVFRSMETTVLALLHTYRVYDAAPPLAFLELHQLYGFAEEQGVLQSDINFEKRRINPISIANLYKQILLLAVTDPFHFALGTTTRIYQLLSEYADLCRIAANEPCAREEGQFVIELTADCPPISCSRVSSAMTFEAPRLLDTGPAVDKVMDRIEQLQQGPESTVSSEELQLLRLLVPELQKSRLRQAPRRPVESSVNVAFGLDAAHYFLSRGNRHALQSLSGSTTGIEVRDLESEEEGRYTLEPWTVANESANGYLLAGPAKWRGLIRVGGAAAIVRPTDHPNAPELVLAIVRWMRNNKSQRVEIGVELIPGTIKAVGCRAADQYTARFGEHYAVLVPAIPALGIPETLMTPKRVYAPERVLVVETEAGSITVHAGKAIAETPHFDRFAFTVID